ncbi:hypothetical protein H009_17888 [Agrobacterium tumefaciens str. Cherry 2E-2-2]|nr:hypothetical protein H009_17888 [Agrobacterium tumefaciens str. Cherry 2E-2-2]
MSADDDRAVRLDGEDINADRTAPDTEEPIKTSPRCHRLQLGFCECQQAASLKDMLGQAEDGIADLVAPATSFLLDVTLGGERIQQSLSDGGTEVEPTSDFAHAERFARVLQEGQDGEPLFQGEIARHKVFL